MIAAQIFSASRWAVLLATLALAACAASLPNGTEGAGGPPSELQPSAATGIAKGVGQPPGAAASTAATSPAPPAASAASQQPSRKVAAAISTQGGQITGFRSQSLMMYFTEVGSDGERIAVSTLPLPMSVAYRSASTGRLEVRTAAGTRWIDARDVSFAALGAPAQN